VRVRACEYAGFWQKTLANIVCIVDGAEVGVRRVTVLLLILKQLIYVRIKCHGRLVMVNINDVP
jgi:hypothetical protein